MESTLTIASNNPNKIQEIMALLQGRFKVISLKEAGIDIDIPEPHDSLEANAHEKSSTIYQLTGNDCFSEDTGLEVAALGGKPGVQTARYAGINATAGENMAKLLNDMKGVTQRHAQFRTVISLILSGKEYQFEGICEGSIATEKAGETGFGYDPVFIPAGSMVRFAEMTLEEKNKFSHRKKAMAKLIDFLSDFYGKN